MKSLQLLVVTGMSGAGRSTALRLLEDLGYYCVDNLPPALLPQLMERLAQQASVHHVGVGIDVRTGTFLEGTESVLDGLVQSGHRVELVFLESQDEELVRRFSETRRSHPLAPLGNLVEAIQRERERMAPLRGRAAYIIDTTGKSVHDLRRLLVDYVAREGERPRMVTRVVSFGFKYGLPVDSDLVFDLRYLPNPHFVREMRPKTGLDPEVASFVLDSAEGRELFAELLNMLRKLLPRYEREGKSYLTIGMGCTGGKHRSVAMAEALVSALSSIGDVRVEHRDISLPGNSGPTSRA